HPALPLSFPTRRSSDLGAAIRPEEPLSDLPLLTSAELHQVATEWNDSRTSYPRETCVHDLVAEWVIRTPEAVAVVFEESRLTYRDRKSTRLNSSHDQIS